MLDLVVVDSPQSFQSRDRVKIGGRWEAGGGDVSRRVGGTKEGLLKRSRLGEGGGRLWERKGWEEQTRRENPIRLKTDPGQILGRDLVREKRVKLIPQLVDEVNSLSEERWVRSRRREGERRRGEEKDKEEEEEGGGEAGEGEGLSLNSVLGGMKRLRPVRRRLLAPGRRAGVRLGGGETSGVEGEKRGLLGWGRRGSSGSEKVRAVSEKSKERRRHLGETTEEKRRWRGSQESEGGRGGEVEGRGGSSIEVQVGRGRQTVVPGRKGKRGEVLSGAGSPLLKTHQPAFKRKPVTTR